MRPNSFEQAIQFTIFSNSIPPQKKINVVLLFNQVMLRKKILYNVNNFSKYKMFQTVFETTKAKTKFTNFFPIFITKNVY